MTFSSCWIETQNDQGGQVLCRLDRPLGSAHYWLPVVLDWANSKGCEVCWVDNCWVRINVSGRQLSEFLAHNVQPDKRPPGADFSPAPDHRYVLVAEEF
jgi:hypothetical protein